MWLLESGTRKAKCGVLDNTGISAGCRCLRRSQTRPCPLASAGQALLTRNHPSKAGTLDSPPLARPHDHSPSLARSSPPGSTSRGPLLPRTR